MMDLLKTEYRDSPKHIVEFHRRLLYPLAGYIFVVVGLTILLRAPYNRRSRLRPLLLAGLAGTIIQILCLVMLNRAENFIWLVWATYAFLLFVGGAMAYSLSAPQTTRVLRCLGA